MSEGKEKRIKYLFGVAIVLGILLRMALSARIPVWIRQSNIHDDQWVVSRAVSILKGEWLGAYDQYTLIKGCFAPLLLAFSYAIGLPYLQLNTILYCIACLFFVYSLQPVIKGRLARFLIFVILLFNPVSYGYSTWQRIYRNGLSQWQVLFVIGCIFRLYIHRMDREIVLLPWALFGGFSLWAFMNTREDGVWILPFVVCAMGVTVISLLIRKNGEKLADKVLKAVIVLLPLFILIVGNRVICTLNKNYYGVSLRNDRDNGNYALVVRDLYLIKPNSEDDALYSSPEYDDQYYNIYLSTMEKAYTASPALARMRGNINAAINRWDAADTGPKDGEPWGDHILFAIRDGVAASGYYQSNLADTEALYARIHQELGEAFRNGILEKRGVSLSAMSAPFQKRDLPKVIREYGHTFLSVLSFEDVQTRVMTSSESLKPEWLYQFENLSGSKAIIKKDTSCTMTIKGWAFAKDDDTKLRTALCTAGGIKIAEVPFVSGKDVYQYFEKKGYVFPNALMSRFNLSIDNYSLQDNLVLKFYNGADTLLYELPLKDADLQKIAETDHIWYSIDAIKESAVDHSEKEISSAQRYVDRANFIGNLYKLAGVPVFVAALVSYLLLTASVWFGMKKKDGNPEAVGVWLLSTGLLLSLIFVVFCVSYISATTFSATNHSYLSPAYTVNLMFCTVTVFYILHAFFRDIFCFKR